MKNGMSIRLKDSADRVYRWKIERVPRAINLLGPGRPSRIVSGWNYIDHDGYVRFAEGNWNDLVFHFKITAENYGLELMQELS
jgi:hypothetical protein